MCRCSSVGLSRSRDPCSPLYSPGEAGVLVGYKVEILVGLRVLVLVGLHEENPIWTTFSSLFTVGNLMGPASTTTMVCANVVLDQSLRTSGCCRTTRTMREKRINGEDRSKGKVAKLVMTPMAVSLHPHLQ